MIQTKINFSEPEPNFNKPEFDGPVYDPALDKDRLSKQIGVIYALMIDGHWRTLSEIRGDTGYPEASISAQLRNLRKLQFGEYNIQKRRRGEPTQGLWEYRVER